MKKILGWDYIPKMLRGQAKYEILSAATFPVVKNEIYHLLYPPPPFIQAKHRRRINSEEKAKVVAAVWCDVLVPVL